MASKSEVIHEAKLSKKERIKRSFMVFQDVNAQLSCESVYDELVEVESKENKENAHRILSQLNLTEKRDEHPLSLSGGQKQRVAIATAVFLEKKYLFFDKPTSGLDYDSMIQVTKLLKNLKADVIAIVTHDEEFINACCDLKLHMRDGNIENIYEIDKK